MPILTIFPQTWAKAQHRVKPVLQTFAMSLALLFGLANQAFAATINVPADQPTIAAAIAAASAGDIIIVAPGTYVLSAAISLNKDVTIDGGDKNTTIIQGSIGLGAQFILISGAGAGATIQNISFDKTDKNGTQAIIALQANNVSVLNCNFTGEYILGDPEVSRGFVISPSITGFLIQNCSFIGLRQPGYIDNNTDGQILNNYVDGTRGWVLDGAGSDVIFNGNTFGTNAVDIALLNGTSLGPPYDPLLTLSANNDNAVFSDQRTAKAYNVTQEISYTTIQAANDAATNGDWIWVSDGNHDEDVNINKSIKVQGSGMNVCTVKGPIGGSASTFQIGASGVILDGMTITRAGNNVTDWNSNLNTIGVAIQGQANDAEIRNCKITGNRNGIDINDSDGNNIHNNIITFNRTGMIFRNRTDNTLVNENEITDNWTLGVLFLDASGGDNDPVQSAANCSFNENTITGNWWGQISDRQNYSQSKNFECNWFGSTSPTVSTIDLTEPGYSTQIPVAYGGSASPPGGQPDILGVASANLDYIRFLVSGTDDEPSTNGFQPTPLSCTGGCSGGGVVINANSNEIFCSIQDAFNAATSGDRLKVKTGTYTENVNVSTGGKNIILAPGNSPGCVTINGDFTLNTGDVLEMEIDGTTPCTEHDQFIVSGTVTLGNATLTIPISIIYAAADGDAITIIDGSSAIVGKFAQGNFVVDGNNDTYYINYAGGVDGFDVVLTKCCAPTLDLGIFNFTAAAPAGVNKLQVKLKPNKDAVNATNSEGTFTIRTLHSNAVSFSYVDSPAPFGYTQIGGVQVIGAYDYFIFHFENGIPPQQNWTKDNEVVLLTLGYSCTKGGVTFELSNGIAVGGDFYLELNGETNPGAQGSFYTPSATSPAVLGITATSNSPVCETMEIDLNSTTSDGFPTYQYSWSGPNSYTNTVADPAPFVAVLASDGVYTVSVTDGNGCTATATTTVSVPATGACVKNENTIKYYPTITQAIDATLTVDGHVLTVPAGTWTEHINVNKDLTLNGANVGVPCGNSRSAESIIKGGANTAVSITDDGVTIDGFQIEGYTGVSSTLFNGITIINNKVFAGSLGIGAIGVSTASLGYTIKDNCVDLTSQVFADFTFSSSPATATSQSPPAAWYTDRYAPAGFTTAVLGGSSRLKQSISAADCETCRPPAYVSSFYNTQGRKFDTDGATSMSIDLYVPAAWASTGKRMAGFWGTMLDNTKEISLYPIIEFTSGADGTGVPRFRVYNNGVWIDKGLPGGFVYDSWVTLTMAISGANVVYTIGNLTETIPGNGSVTNANVILQGHNTASPGVTYDIHWDNFSSNCAALATTNVPSVGVALLGASGTNAVTVQDNSVTDAFYGYLLNGVNTTTRTMVKGGSYTNLLQGAVVSNSLTGGAPYAPSTVGVENLSFENFGGDYPHLAAVNFHAGVYVFTGGSNAGDKVDVLINGVTVKNTGKTTQSSAGLYFADFSTGAGNRLNAVVNLSTIDNNKNRGVQIRGANATATVNTSSIAGNGADPFGAGGNHGFGVYAGVGSQVTLLNNYITNPAVQVSDNVTALFEGVAPASTIIAHDNKINRNGNGELTFTTNGSINGTCNWWGSSFIDVIDADVDGNVTFIPYLNAGTDFDAPSNGFQPTAPCVNPKRWYVNDNALAGDIYTSAVGNDLNQGTKRRPFLTIGKAITTVVSTDTIFVDAGGYNEQSVVPDTKDNLLFKGAGLPTIVDFTGSVTNKPTLFDIAGDNTTIDGFKFKVDLSKLSSAIIATDPLPGTLGTLDLITIKNNTIEPYKSAGLFGSYGDRNAISINYGGSTNYRNAVGGVNSIIVDNNIVSATVVGPILGDADDIAFRSAVSVDEGAGTYTRNTFQTINHDILVRFNSNGPILIGGSVANKNYFNGGGVTVAEHNAGGGIVTISENAFDGSYTGSVLRLVTNKQHKATTVENNTFNNLRWGISLENYPDVTVSGNTFTPLAGYTSFRHITVNTKELSTSGATQLQVPINGTFTSNTFNSLTPTVGGTAIAFYNHDSDNATLGTFTMGGAGALANVFKKDFTYAAYMGDQTGSTIPAPVAFPEYALGAGSNTNMVCWDKDVDLTNNTFDVGSGQQLPLSMNNANRVLLEGILYHKPDASCLGRFFQPVEVMAKVFLQGPYDQSSGKMSDALRAASLIPTATTPYTQIEIDFPGSFTKVANSVVESITGPTVLNDFGDNSIVDWVWLELRDKNNSNTVLFTRSALVQRDGDIVDLDGTSEVSFPNSYQDQYYLMVRHRNHLAAMTAVAKDFTNPGTFVDFTSSSMATFGTTPTSARKLLKTPGIYGLLAGNTFPKDTPGNGGAFRVLYNGSNNDRTPILNRVGVSTPLNIVIGYYLEDVNMNSEVKYSGSNNDRVIILNNVGASTPLNFVTQEPNN